MIVNCAIVGMMDLGYNASSLLREYTGVISEWRDVDSIISIDCEESVIGMKFSFLYMTIVTIERNE